jgi:hypothetical protein
MMLTMATTDEQLGVLRMLRAGEITVEEAFELLDAYRRHEQAPPPPPARGRRSLRLVSI